MSTLRPNMTLEEMTRRIDLARNQPNVPPTPPGSVAFEDILLEILKRIQALEQKLLPAGEGENDGDGSD